MPHLGKVGPHLENRMRDCKIFLSPEIALSRHSWQMARLGELAGLGHSADVSSWPHFKDNRANPRGGGAVPRHPGLLPPQARLGQGQLVRQPAAWIWDTDLPPE